ncbi:hypothetical protein [Arthrobacter globiformis]|uniref:hypothetical protein n=1 Tax=Arthrobacter globiformis TaxID=1665 RepID=UPI00279157E7|nr:hypothetical protein [Arthrobacter globiformis]MDQ0620052.1 hypothetical protein [Arthrobacter globiformis]
MTRNQDIDALLRTLDAADPQRSTNAHRVRPDLQRILATDTGQEPQQQSAPSGVIDKTRSARRTGRPVRRFAIVGGMVAAATAGLIVLPSLSGGDLAFASWTPAPASMSEQDRAAAAADCRSSQKGTGGGMYAADVVSAQLAIAERRGVWTTVVLSGAGGFSVMCITDDFASLFTKGMIGSIGKPANQASPGPRELIATDLGTGSMSAGYISLAAGAAGSDIAEVSYVSRAHQKVKATVSQGRFALWLPGDELQDAASNGVEVEVTYRNGTKGTSHLTL